MSSKNRPPPYKVRWHLTQMLYFPPDGPLPNGQAIQDCWHASEIVPLRRKVGAFFWTDEDLHAIREKPSYSKVGDRLTHEVFQNAGRSPVFGCASYQRSNVEKSIRDCDFEFGFSDGGPTNFGTVPAHFKYSLSQPLVEAVENDSLRDLLLTHYEILDEFQPCHGLISAFSSPETYGAMMFGPILHLNTSWEQWGAHARWLRSLNSGTQRVRGLYWGNYFGNALLESGGGADAFMKAVEEIIGPRSDPDRPFARRFPNGVFFALSSTVGGRSPSESRDGISPIVPRMIAEFTDLLLDWNLI